MSKEKTTKRSALIDEKQLAKQNEWLAYLKDGRKRKKPSLGAKNKAEGKRYLQNPRQQRALVDGTRRQVFIGELNKKQRKALLSG